MGDNSNHGVLYFIYGIVVVFAFYSIISTIWIIYYSSTLKSHNTILMMISRNILVANAIHVISYILNWVEWNDKESSLLFNSDSLCQFQSFLMSSSSISQGLWIIFYELIHTLSIISNLRRKGTRRIKSSVLYIIGYFLPALLCFFFLFQQEKVYGPNDIYCYFDKLKSTEGSVTKRCQNIIFILRWIIIIIIAIFSILYVVFICMKKISLQQYKFNKNLTWRLLSYPLIQLYGTLYPTLYRYFGISVSFGNSYLIVLLGGSQGILFPFCFFITSEGFFSACIKCKKDTSDIDTLDRADSELSTDVLNLSLDDTNP